MAIPSVHICDILRQRKSTIRIVIDAAATSYAERILSAVT
jgi:ATP-dependent protease ClpP protease subunit